MNFEYEFGPDTDFEIRHVGDMKKHNGSYEATNHKGQYLDQVLCHAIYEIKDEVKNSEAGILKIRENLWVHYLLINDKDDYSVYTDMMTALHIIQTGENSFDIEFISPRQCLKLDPLLDYACNHKSVKRKIK